MFTDIRINQKFLIDFQRKKTQKQKINDTFGIATISSPPSRYSKIGGATPVCKVVWR